MHESNMEERNSRKTERAQVSIDNFNRVFAGIEAYLTQQSLCGQEDCQHIKNMPLSC